MAKVAPQTLAIVGSVLPQLPVYPTKLESVKEYPGVHSVRGKGKVVVL